jgi:ATP-dependent DNA helicase
MSSDIAKMISDFQMQELLEALHITHLNPVQVEAVERGLFFHRDFLVCTPSGSGKTLIGLMAIGECLLKSIGKAIYLVPYKALSSEKADQFGSLFSPFNITVKSLTGDSEQEDQHLDDTDLLITTFEKCDALLRSKSTFLDQVKVIVIDEIHEISTQSRGPRLEILLVRLLSRLLFPQIIALSATIRNYQQFADWLSSFKCNNRPFVLIHNDKRPIKLNYRLEVASNKITAIKKLLLPALVANQQVLIFVNKRKLCIRYCNDLKNLVAQSLSQKQKTQCLKAKRTLENKRTLARNLVDVVEFGVAYHNAALGAGERKLVEALFRDQGAKVLVATTTLAAGINTPAQMVIVADIIQHQKYINLEEKDYQDQNYTMAHGAHGLIRPISPNLMFQMLGRAGRLGHGMRQEDAGEGIMLLRHPKEKEFAQSYYFEHNFDAQGDVIPKYSDLFSQLNDHRILQEIVLLHISENGDVNKASISSFLKQTFYAFLQKRRLKTYKNQSKIKHTDQLKENLINYFFIEKMDLPFFVRCYGNSSFIDSPQSELSIEIKNMSGTRISGTVHVEGSMKHFEIDLHTGITCSCHPSKRFLIELANDNSFHARICSHVSYFIHQVSNQPKSKPYLILKSLLPVLAKHEYIFDYLKQEGLVAVSKQKSCFRITSFGKLAISLYIYPSEAVWVKTQLKTLSFSKESFLLDKVIEFWQLNESKKHSQVKSIISLWIEEYTLTHIIQSHPYFGVGDIFRLKGELARTSMIFEAIAQFLGRQDVAVRFQQLQYRLLHGIKSNLTDLMIRAHPHLSRNKARILYNAGYHTYSQLIVDKPIDIHLRTKLKLSKVMEILGKIAPVVKQHSMVEYFGEKSNGRQT